MLFQPIILSCHGRRLLIWKQKVQTDICLSLPPYAQGIPKNSITHFYWGLQWDEGVKFSESTTEQTRRLQPRELLGINLTLPQELLQEWFDSPEQQLSHLWAIAAIGNWKTKPIIRIFKFTRKGHKAPLGKTKKSTCMEQHHSTGSYYTRSLEQWTQMGPLKARLWFPPIQCCLGHLQGSEILFLRCRRPQSPSQVSYMLQSFHLSHDEQPRTHFTAAGFSCADDARLELKAVQLREFPGPFFWHSLVIPAKNQPPQQLRTSITCSKKATWTLVCSRRWEQDGSCWILVHHNYWQWLQLL